MKNNRIITVITIVIAILTIGITFFMTDHSQNKKLTYEPSEVPYLEPIKKDELKKWHNKEVKFVYITFDDGPTRNTEALLDILNEYNVPSTFFLLGDAINRSSRSGELLPRMLDEGHYIALHSMTHEYQNLYAGPNAPQNFVKEMKEAQALVAKHTNGFETILTRAPYGTGGGTFKPGHVTAVADAGFKVWDWDVDSMDWSYSEEEVMNNIRTYTENNQNKQHLVVLFHEKDTTLAVLPRVIKYYQDLGYEFAAYDPEHHVVKNFMNSEEL